MVSYLFIWICALVAFFGGFEFLGFLRYGIALVGAHLLVMGCGLFFKNKLIRFLENILLTQVIILIIFFGTRTVLILPKGFSFIVFFLQLFLFIVHVFSYVKYKGVYSVGLQVVSFFSVLVLLYIGLDRVKFDETTWRQDIQHIAKKPVADTDGLKKIFYVLDHTVLAKNVFFLDGEYHRFHDPYDICYVNQRELIVCYQRLNKVITFDLVSGTKDIYSIDSDFSFFDDSANKLYVGQSKCRATDASFFTMDLHSTAKAITQTDISTQPKFIYDILGKSDGFRGGCVFDDALYIYTLAGRVLKFNRKTSKVEKEVRVAYPLPLGVINYSALNSDDGILYLSSIYGIYSVNLKDLSYSFKFSKVPQKIRYSIQTHQLVVSHPFVGKIELLNTQTLAVEKTYSVSKGCYTFDFDPNWRYLFLGDYFNGRVDIFDTRLRKVIKSIYVGKLVRAITYAPAVHKLYIGSALGIFEYDVSLIAKDTSDL